MAKATRAVTFRICILGYITQDRTSQIASNKEEQSGFQTPIQIRVAIENIFRKNYILPAIQREFVWDTQQIVKLFDSLMQGYPINSFLLWKIDKSKINEFHYYDFITDYDERKEGTTPEPT